MTPAAEQPQRGGRPGRSTPILGVLAALLALWLGLTAPNVSPVAPGPPGQQVSSAVDQGVDQPFALDRDRGGRGGR